MLGRLSLGLLKWFVAPESRRLVLMFQLLMHRWRHRLNFNVCLLCCAVSLRTGPVRNVICAVECCEDEKPVATRRETVAYFIDFDFA